MKRIFPFGLLLLSGCSTTNISDLVGQLKNDPAIVVGSVMTPYGSMKFTRVGASATNQNVTVTADGTITVTGKP